MIRHGGIYKVLPNSNKLYDICFPDSIASSDAKSYIRWQGSVIATKSALFLCKGSSVATDTYHNLLAVKKIRKYTFYKDFEFRVVGVGNCQIDLIAMGKGENYIYEHIISSQSFFGSFLASLKFNDIENQYDTLYLSISTYEDTTISNIGIFSNPITVTNEVSIAYCICSYNHENYISSFVKNIASQFLHNPNIFFYIAINGEPYSLSFSENFNVLKNRNLGAAGGFTKSIITALNSKNHSHIILANDDILVNKASIYKTIALLKGLKPEYSDYLISSAMLSADEKWLQYERNSSLTKRGFILHGANEDTRSKDLAFYTAIAPTKLGIAKWRYCCIPVKVMKEYKLPLPIFGHGYDVEYSIRCAKNILSFNGICVWHKPSVKNYNEVMEDYYLVRNLGIISIIYSREFSKLRFYYIFKKFCTNIFLFDYVSARLNIKALEDILNKEYLSDAEILHKKIVEYKNQNIDYEEYEGSIFISTQQKRIPKTKCIFKGILQYFFNIKHGSVSSFGGDSRNIKSFFGKKRAHIYIGNNLYRLYKFNFKKTWKLMFLFVKLYIKIVRMDSKLQKELIFFRDNFSELSSWENIFKNN